MYAHTMTRIHATLESQGDIQDNESTQGFEKTD